METKNEEEDDVVVTSVNNTHVNVAGVNLLGNGSPSTSIVDFIHNSESIEQMCSYFRFEDPFVDILSQQASHVLSSLYSLMNNNGKYNKEKASLSKKGKNVLEGSWAAFQRIISFSDLFTDGYLLYLVSDYTTDEIPELLSFGVVLCISILAPYIVSYSCGVRLFFFKS